MTVKLQDLVFVANNGIVLQHTPIYIGSNFKATNRIGEEVIGMRFFDSLGYKTIRSPFEFEGEAELKYLRDNIYIGGYGIRSDKRAYEWMESEFGMNIIKLELKDPKNYHLDCTIFSSHKRECDSGGRLFHEGRDQEYRKTWLI